VTQFHDIDKRVKQETDARALMKTALSSQFELRLIYNIYRSTTCS